MMKLIVVLLSLAAFVLAVPPWMRDSKFQESKTLWKAYKKNFKREHKCQEDEDRAYNRFLKHKKHIEDHQQLIEKGIATFEIDLNKFADIDEEEFVKTHCGTNATLAPPNEKVKMIQVPLSRQSAPSTWDIRVNGPGSLAGVKDQQACGSCWAFSVSCVLENAYSQTARGLVVLSEQQQLDCNTYTDGCDGGWFSTAFKYTIEKGLTSSASYPYVATENTCKDSLKYRPYTQKSFVQIANDPAQIQAYIRNYGACSTCVDANNWQLYNSGIFNRAGNNPQCNHAVAIVGYGPGYWLIKNSWGTDWGEAGYIRVSSTGGGGIFTQYVYAPKLS